MLFQVASDLHLERKGSYPKIYNPEYPVRFLFLAGDIGHINSKTYLEFLRYVNEAYERVFYVLGNHEHYGFSISGAREAYRELLKGFRRITLMDKSVSYADGIPVLGCTLFTRVQSAFTKTLNDFNFIRSGDEGCIHDLSSMISLEEYNSLYSEDSKWLLSTMDIYDRPIVLTHFPFCNVVYDSPMKERSGGYYINNLNIQSPHISIHGHTHRRIFATDHINTYISNPCGYEHEFCRYEPKRIFNITLSDRDGRYIVGSPFGGGFYHHLNFTRYKGAVGSM